MIDRWIRIAIGVVLFCAGFLAGFIFLMLVTAKVVAGQ